VPAAKPLGLAPTCTVFVAVPGGPVVPDVPLMVIQDWSLLKVKGNGQQVLS